MSVPKVSVLMSCKNSKPDLLKASIFSVLNQSFNDFDFIIVIDDSSDYPIEPIIHSISSDKRIRIFHIPSSGLGEALNYGISQSQADYIARIDDDDLMSKERLEKQVQYLEQHQDVSCVGSQRYSFCNGRFMKHRKFPTEHDEIVESMLSLKWAMAHTAMTYRRDCINKIGGYRVKGIGEDLDLILQLSTVGRLANLDSYLLYYYLTMGSLATRNNVKHLNGHLYALNEYLNIAEPRYVPLIKKSISTIKNELSDVDRKFCWKKWITVHVVSWFGKKIPEIL